jgi:hypothetical protein
MDLPKGAPLPCSAVVARAVRPEYVKNRPKVSKSAFIPRNDGSDVDGLSVTVNVSEAAVRLRAKLSAAPIEVVTLHVGRVRNIRLDDVAELKLDVLFSPEDDDPFHALLTGILASLSKENKLSKEGRRMQERFAEKLAEQARCCL